MIRKNSDNTLTRALKKIKRHNGVIAVGIIVLLIVSVFLFADRGFLHFYRSYNEREQLREEIEELEKKKVLLLEEKEKLENDPQHIEKIAREKYKMKKKEEKVYQIETDKEK